MSRTPLAWLQLTREKRRFLAAVAGIAFAVVLMLMQLGFEEALLASSDLVQSRLAGDLVLISPNYQYILSPKSFTDRRLVQALGSDGVASIAGLYLGSASFKNPFDRTERDIFVIGFKPEFAVLNNPGVAENLAKIRIPGVALFDSIHRAEFGPVEQVYKEDKPVVAELSGHRVEIAGLYTMGTSFAFDGSMIVSDETFLDIFQGRKRGIIDLGLIKLKPGADPESVKRELARILPVDVTVLTQKEFAVKEKAYWTTNTPVGFIFKLGVLMGIFVGCIIVYQILYSDVTDHLPEYATLKAMGYRDRFLFKVVLQESVILSIFGFFPGVFVSYFLYGLSRDATQLPLEMSLQRSASVYVLTLAMCAISAALAMRRLKAADPAEIF
jgi:putative ABC transport system permease protein